jgi:stage V sporulation protein B
MAEKKTNSFFGGAGILAAGILIVKVISAIYKMPLVNILGSSGYADFSAAFNIFNILLMISTAGIPVAMSKMISQSLAENRLNQTRKIFRVAFAFFLAVGIFCSLIMLVFASQFASLMNDTKAVWCIRVLAPSVALVCCLACFRGYAQGHRNMTPSSISQIIEALFKLIVGLTLAWYLICVLGKEESIGAAGAIVGVTVSELAAVIYMAWDFWRTRRSEPRHASDRPSETSAILKTCLALAIPISLTSASTSIITAVDNSLVMGRLQNALDMTEKAARSLMGNYTGVQTVYQIPAALMVAITASVIPAVTVCFTRHDRPGAARIVGSALKTAALIALPSGVGMIVLGTPITKLLFHSLDSSIAGPILSILGLANIFVCLMLVCNSILQSHGVLNLPIVTMLVGGVIMVLFDFFMVAIPSINIFGSPIGTCICYGVTCTLDLIIVRRIVPNCPSFLTVFGKPVLASVIMGAAAWGSYGLIHRVTGSNTVATLLAVILAVAVYAVLVVALKTLTRDDLSLMPKGDKIARLLHIQ